MKHEKLIEIRKSKGISQSKMANALAMEQTTYSKKERGISPIHDFEWKRISKFLGVSLEELKAPNIEGEVNFIDKIQELIEENANLKKLLKNQSN